MDASNVTGISWADAVALIASFALMAERIIALRKVKAENKKAEAEAQKTETEANETLRQTVMALIDPLKKRIDELQAEVNELREENADLRDWAERLVAQVKGLGAEPVKLKVRHDSRRNPQ